MNHLNHSEHEATTLNEASAGGPLWPRSPAEATVFFKNEGVEWFAVLPEPLQEMWCDDLLDTYKTFRENAAIACALETKANELAGIFERLCLELEAQGLTLAHLRAFELQSRGESPFNTKAPRSVLPSGYRHREQA